MAADISARLASVEKALVATKAQVDEIDDRVMAADGSMRGQPDEDERKQRHMAQGGPPKPHAPGKSSGNGTSKTAPGANLEKFKNPHVGAIVRALSASAQRELASADLPADVKADVLAAMEHDDEDEKHKRDPEMAEDEEKGRAERERERMMGMGDDHEGEGEDGLAKRRLNEMKRAGRERMESLGASTGAANGGMFAAVDRRLANIESALFPTGHADSKYAEVQQYMRAQGMDTTPFDRLYASMSPDAKARVAAAEGPTEALVASRGDSQFIDLDDDMVEALSAQW